jgi:hypothetical protein
VPDQSSVLLSQTSLDSLARVLSRLEGGSVKHLFLSHETEEGTGASIWTVFAQSSDPLLSQKDVIRIVSGLQRPS